MPTVRCRMADCVHWDENYCTANRINIDDEGLCLTYSSLDEALDDLEQDDDWEDDLEDDEEEEVLADDAEEDYEDESSVRGRRRWEDW